MTILTRLLYPFTSPEARRIAKLIRDNPDGLEQADLSFYAWSKNGLRVGMKISTWNNRARTLTVSIGNVASSNWSISDMRLIFDAVDAIRDIAAAKRREQLNKALTPNP